MCSIYGAIGHTINDELFDQLRFNARDRGRDGGDFQEYHLLGGRVARLGNWRATPTPEVERAPFQPYDGVVHNGTIANDRELGGVEGEVDSMVLPRVLKRNNFESFVESLAPIRGSYALAVVSDRTIFLACNYKPIHYWRHPYTHTFYFSSMERHFHGIVPQSERPSRMLPYTAMDVSTYQSRRLPRTFARRVVVIASTGLDSTVVATQLVRERWEVILLHFRYGCKAEPREVERIARIASALRVRYKVLPVDFKALFGGTSTLLDGSDESIGGTIEGSEYAIDWVPARNLVMLSMATAFAEANGYHAIALGNNLEESGSFPDNEEEFTTLFGDLLPYATQNGYRVDVLMPVGNLMKHEIVKLGLELNAPLEHTWSCYRAGDVPCNNCGPDFMRRMAFKRNGIKDPAFKHEWSDPFWTGCKEPQLCF